jgi:hypothetical protein
MEFDLIQELTIATPEADLHFVARYQVVPICFIDGLKVAQYDQVS